MTNSEKALELVRDGMTLGLGSGRAAAAFIRTLGERVQAGLHVKGVPTSQGSAALAISLGIPLVTLDEVDHLDIDVDGADEVDPQLNLIKGLGGALVREKIVAAASKQLVILVGTEKVVSVLGDRGVLPVEVVPFALAAVRRQVTKMGMPPKLREASGKPFVTDNGNRILDLRVQAIADPAKLEATLLAIPGVVGTGLFLGMTDLVLIQDGDNVQTRQRSRS